MWKALTKKVEQTDAEGLVMGAILFILLGLIPLLGVIYAIIEGLTTP
jgi:hypothetical protein